MRGAGLVFAPWLRCNPPGMPVRYPPAQDTKLIPPSDAIWSENALAEETFLDAFAAQNSPENIAAYVARAFSAGQITTELSTPESRFYFIEAAGDIAGYLKLNQGAAQTERDLPNALEIERIYVRRAHQGTGAGTALMRHAIEIATSTGRDWLWLGVWDQNLKAIGFYTSLGFTPFGAHDFYMGTELQRDLLMKLAIPATTRV